jgi:hypothetical protein
MSLQEGAGLDAGVWRGRELRGEKGQHEDGE